MEYDFYFKIFTGEWVKFPDTFISPKDCENFAARFMKAHKIQHCEWRIKGTVFDPDKW